MVRQGTAVVRVPGEGAARRWRPRPRSGRVSAFWLHVDASRETAEG